MAKTLVDAGYPVVGHNCSNEPVADLVDYGGAAGDGSRSRDLQTDGRKREGRENNSGVRQTVETAAGDEARAD